MLRVASVFSNHMVLQRDKNIEIFGYTSENEVTVSINGEQKEVVKAYVNEMTPEEALQENGDYKRNFTAVLSPKMAGGPYTVKISSEKEEVVFQDVMIGEVYLAGGQSNMEFELQNCNGGLEELEEENTLVRFYYTPKVTYVGETLFEEEKKSSWQNFSKETAYYWSAVGYFFAKELSKKLGVTVGIIGCNWGGTSASCWVSREALLSHQATRSYVDEYDKVTEGLILEEYIKEDEEYKIYQAAFDKNVSHYYETAENPTWDEAISLFGENRYPGPMGPHAFTRPYGLYESMLKRVMPYTLRGFLFYQGEEDDYKPYHYHALLRTLVNQWRKDWHDNTLPFLNVQLPVFRDEQEKGENMSWPFLREAEMDVFNEMKNTGIAVILDCGEDKNVHPKDKKTVGYRLYLQALSEVYGIIEKKDAFGPLYRDVRIDESGSKMILSFDFAENGFVIQNGEVEGFEIAEADGKYVEAEVEIHKDTIILSSKSTKRPAFARYMWKNFGKVTVFSENGLPLAPFRTSREDHAISFGNRQGKPVFPADESAKY